MAVAVERKAAPVAVGIAVDLGVAVRPEVPVEVAKLLKMKLPAAKKRLPNPSSSKPTASRGAPSS